MDALREEMCAIGRRAYQRGLVAGTEGNFSARLDDGRILCTPTNLCKGLLEPDDLVVVDETGRHLAGSRRASSEVRMHLDLYRQVPKIEAVVHAHPPYATTFSVLEEGLPSGLLPEAELFLGAVPVTRYANTGTAELAAAVVELAANHPAVLLSHHGAATWSDELEDAYCLMETLEAVARVVYQARLLGAPQPVAPTYLAELAERRLQRGSA